MIEPTDSQRANLDMGDAPDDSTWPSWHEVKNGGCFEALAGCAMVFVVFLCVLLVAILSVALLVSFVR